MLTKCTSCLVLIFCSIRVNSENVTGLRSSTDPLADSNVIAANYIYQQYGDGPAQLFYLDKHERFDELQVPQANFSAANKSGRQQMHVPASEQRSQIKPNMPRSREMTARLAPVPQTMFPQPIAKLIGELHSPQLPNAKPPRLKTEFPPTKPVQSNAVEQSIEMPVKTSVKDEPELNLKEITPDVIKEQHGPPKNSPFPKTKIIGMILHNNSDKQKNVSRPHYSHAHYYTPYGNKIHPKQHLRNNPRPIHFPKKFHLYSTPLVIRPQVTYIYKPPRAKPRPQPHRTNQMKIYATMLNVPPRVWKAIRHISRTQKPHPPSPPIILHPNHTHKKKSESKSEEESSEKKSKHKSGSKKEKQHSQDGSDDSEGSESDEKSRKRGHKSEKKDEKGSYEESEKGFEKSGGSQFSEEEHKKKGFADSKEYKQFDSFGKGKKGHYDEEDYHEFDDAEYEKEASKSKAADEHSHKHEANKGENSGKFDEKKSHKKGSKTTGYHNVFHKDEYKKVHTFYDDADHKGNYKNYGSDHSQHESGAGAAKSNHHRQSSNEHTDEGAKRKTRNGLHSTEDTGYRKKSGNDRHHSDEENYSKKGGKRNRHEHGRELEGHNWTATVILSVIWKAKEKKIE